MCRESKSSINENLRYKRDTCLGPYIEYVSHSRPAFLQADTLQRYWTTAFAVLIGLGWVFWNS